MKEIIENDLVVLTPGVAQGVLPQYEKLVAEQLTEEKGRVIDRYFTNRDEDIVAMRDIMPGVIAGALVARTSRAAEDDIREVFWKEFYKQSEFELARDKGVELVRAGRKADAIIGRILADYGDDSVREQASGYVAVRRHSILSSLNVFRAKLISAIEASTRYIPWGEEVDGRFRYLRNERIMDSKYADIYVATADQLFEAYGKILPHLFAYVEEKNPPGDLDKGPYDLAVRGRVFDNLRKLLPLASYTNYVLFGTFRTLSEMVMDLRASPYSEDREVVNGMAKELLTVNPKFMEVVESRHAEPWTRHRVQVQEIVDRAVGVWGDQVWMGGGESRVGVRVVNKNWQKDLALGLVDSYKKSPAHQRESVAEVMAKNGQVAEIIKRLGEARGNRRHKVTDAFQRVVIEANFEGLSLSVIKDFNRQRNILDKSVIDWSADLGFYVPEDIEELGGEVLDDYNRAVGRAIEVYHLMRKDYPEEAKLILPQATKSRLTITMGLAEALWISELRTIPSGDPEYRPFGRMLWEGTVSAMPELAGMKNFVDGNDYPLNRIKEAVRADLEKGVGGSEI